MTTDEQIVESSPTPEVVEAVEPEAAESAPVEQEPVPLEEFTSSQRTEWLKTGEVPTRAKSAESPSVEAETETDSAPVKPKGKGADSRIQELLKDRKELRTKLEAAERKLNPEPTQETEATLSAAPKEENFETWEAFRSAEIKHFKEVAKAEARRELQQEQTQKQQDDELKTLGSEWDKREVEFKKTNPDFDVNDAAEAISGFKNYQTMAALIIRSPQGPQVAHYLMENPDVAEKIGTAEPLEAVRQITKLELKFETPAGQAVSKPISKSGPPARDLSGNASPVDPIKQAIANGDMRTYTKLMNAKEGRK